MKCFLISYKFSEGSEDAWHAEIAKFISELENNPIIGGKVSYRVMKSTKGPEYYHLATPVDEDAVKLLGEQAFFKHYTEQTELVSGGSVTVTPLEIISQTK